MKITGYVPARMVNFDKCAVYEEDEGIKEVEEKEPDIAVPIWEGKYVRLSIVADLEKEKKK